MSDPKRSGKVSDQLGPHCPECETPNQVGEVCDGCQPEVDRQNTAEETFNERHSLYEYGD